MDDDFGGPESHAGDAHRRRASHLYGLVGTGAVLATAPEDFRIRRVALVLVCTLCIYWVAETFVHWTATRTVLQRDLNRHERRAVILDGWPLVAASGVPLALLFVEGLLQFDTSTAVFLAHAATIVLLVVVGYQMGRTGGLTGVRLWGAAVLVGLLGVAMITLKALLH